jgi:hypothetical protein
MVLPVIFTGPAIVGSCFSVFRIAAADNRRVTLGPQRQGKDQTQKGTFDFFHYFVIVPEQN